jgi:deazaflavin-dependent oxidoreductase (nitroreductase family)
MRRYGDLLARLSRTRWFTWLSINVLVPIDRFLYRRTDGRLSLMHTRGGRSIALPSLLLTTTGCKTGKVRTTPVLYLETDGRVFVVASNFGQQHHPAWSANLIASPDATIQIHTRKQDVRAHLASDEDLQRLWPKLLEIYPTWTDYRTRTDRPFRAFFLEPV